MNKRELYENIEWFRRKMEITSFDYPLNCIDIADYLNDVIIEYITIKNKKIGGAFIRGDKTHTIILNNNHDLIEQNFYCGHEIMHGIFDSNNDSIEYSFTLSIENIKSSQDTFKEWRANEGAAEFLVPYKSFIPRIAEEYSLLKNWSDIYKFKKTLANEYFVTDAVIFFRIESLKYELKQYINGTPLDEIEIKSNNQLKREGIFIKSLNDIENECFSSIVSGWKKEKRLKEEDQIFV